MPVTPKLVYFEHWMDPEGPRHVEEKILGLEMVRLEMNQSPDSIWKHMETAHGYQMLPVTETKSDYFPQKILIEKCPNLLCVSSSGAGYDQVDVEACTKAGILVVNQAGANAESVAQHTLGLMLVLSKQIIQSDRAIRKKKRDWSRWTYMGAELTGRTLGLIGLGNIGKRVAKICRDVFSMRVLAFDPFLTENECENRCAKKVTLTELLTQSDIVSIHCPLSESSRGMIGFEEFKKMKSGAFFISTARGGIHDEDALERALSNNLIGGAGLDVFEIEPPPVGHPILLHPNTIVSPHNAGITSDCLYNMSLSAAQQWVQIFSAKQPSLLVNPKAWELYCERFENMFGIRPRKNGG